jgi:glycosyltransferase involved in cell wall biosynthesis
VTEPLHVLVWGDVRHGPCAVYRGSMYEAALRDLGVEMRSVNRMDQEVKVVDRNGDPFLLEMIRPEQMHAMFLSGEARIKAQVQGDDFTWADVVMFRRYYNTHYKCPVCSFRTHDKATADSHPHGYVRRQDGTGERDVITRIVWDVVSRKAQHGIVYDTDDYLAGVQPWNGFFPDIRAELPLANDMLRRADIVTVSTPVLAKYINAYSSRVRVVRNAVNPDWYVPDEADPEDDRVRVLYYGNGARLRDYMGWPADGTPNADQLANNDGRAINYGRWEGGYPYKAVSELNRQVRTVFVGAEPKTRAAISRLFEEVRPYVTGIPAFARALCNAHGDIGLAPLLGDTFDQAKSELHWLEYSLAGCATIASRYTGGPDNGPYNMIRHGVDGVLAKGRQEWSDGMKLLLDRSRREDIAAAARERVLREYNYLDRAKEWADVFVWAAENRGIGA